MLTPTPSPAPAPTPAPTPGPATGMRRHAMELRKLEAFFRMSAITQTLEFIDSEPQFDQNFIEELWKLTRDTSPGTINQRVSRLRELLWDEERRFFRLHKKRAVRIAEAEDKISKDDKDLADLETVSDRSESFLKTSRKIKSLLTEFEQIASVQPLADAVMEAADRLSELGHK